MRQLLKEALKVRESLTIKNLWMLKCSRQAIMLDRYMRVRYYEKVKRKCFRETS